MAWHEPKDKDEYDSRIAAAMNMNAPEGSGIITGFGRDVTTHMPCPWCATPDFMLLRIMQVHEDMAAEATCRNCGRSGKHLIGKDESGSMIATFVQTGGQPPPEWLEPAPMQIGDTRLAVFRRKAGLDP